jgi:hypothetical protein
LITTHVSAQNHNIMAESTYKIEKKSYKVCLVPQKWKGVKTSYESYSYRVYSMEFAGLTQNHNRIDNRCGVQPIKILHFSTKNYCKILQFIAKF